MTAASRSFTITSLTETLGGFHPDVLFRPQVSHAKDPFGPDVLVELTVAPIGPHFGSYARFIILFGHTASTGRWRNALLPRGLRFKEGRASADAPDTNRTTERSENETIVSLVRWSSCV